MATVAKTFKPTEFLLQTFVSGRVSLNAGNMPDDCPDIARTMLLFNIF